MRRVAIATLLVAATACGLTFSPGDYEAPALADSGVLGDVIVPPPPDTGARVEAGPIDAGPPPARIALFAGRREAVAGETGSAVNVAETMLTTLDRAGDLGKFTFDAPPPAAAQWTHALFAGGTVYVNGTGIVASASLGERVGTWTSIGFPGAPESSWRPWMLDPRGPLGTGAATYFGSISDGGISGWTKLSGTPTVARIATTLIRAGSFVYVVGGNTPGGLFPPPFGDQELLSHPEVEVAKLGDDAEPSTFHTTTALPSLGDGGGAGVFAPIGAGTSDRIFLLGGLATTAASSLSDRALTAKIKDPATGDLDTWTALPTLPSVMNAFAAVVTPDWLVVFGGETAPGKTTDTIYRLAIHADGTFGSAWESAGSLPAKRSSLVGVTY